MQQRRPPSALGPTRTRRDTRSEPLPRTPHRGATPSPRPRLRRRQRHCLARLRAFASSLCLALICRATHPMARFGYRQPPTSTRARADPNAGLRLDGAELRSDEQRAGSFWAMRAPLMGGRDTRWKTLGTQRTWAGPKEEHSKARRVAGRSSFDI